MAAPSSPNVSDDRKVTVSSLKEGELTKQGGNVHNWKKRWFILTQNKLCYYTNRKAAQANTDRPTGTLYLDGPVEVFPVQNMRGYFGSKMENVFAVRVGRSTSGSKIFNNRIFYFRTTTKAEQEEWINSIKETVARHQAQASTAAPSSSVPTQTPMTTPTTSPAPSTPAASATSKPIVLVTGATGNVGRAVVAHLLEKGRGSLIVRAASRTTSGPAASALLEAGAEVVAFDFANPATIDVALKGVDKVFMCVAVSTEMVSQGRALYEAMVRAKSSGAASLRHVVKLSAVGVDGGSIMLAKWHKELDDLVRGSAGWIWTLVRPNNFFQNIGNFFGSAIQAGNGIAAPWGSAAVAYVDARDVGAVAAEALLNSEHEQFANKAIDVNGPEALNHSQIAEILTKEIGRPVRYVDISEAAYAETMMRFGTPRLLVDALLELWGIVRQGWAANTANQIQEITGRRPRTFVEYVRDHRALFRGKGRLVLVTGATGNVGRAAVAALVAAGAAVRAATRNPEKTRNARDLHLLGADIVELDWTRPSTVDAALAGVEAVLLIDAFSPNLVDDGRAAIDAVGAHAAGKGGSVKHIVRISVSGAGTLPNTVAKWHGELDDKLIAMATPANSGLAYTILRPNAFHQNLANFYGIAIKLARNFAAPFGNEDTRAAYVDSGDVGAVAAEALLRPADFYNRILELHGPESLSPYDLAAIVSKVTRTHVSYTEISTEQYARTMLSFGAPEAIVTPLVELYEEYRRGSLAATGDVAGDDAIRAALGRPPRTFEQYVREHVGAFVQKTVVLVTGATGNVGEHVVERLLTSLSPRAGGGKLTVRAATRQPDRAAHLRHLGADVVEWDWTRPETIDAALRGVDKVFFLVPLSTEFMAHGRMLLDAIMRANKTGAARVKHIVKLSAVGVDSGGILLAKWHKELDDAIRSSGIAYTIIRPNSFFQNIGNFFGGAIKAGVGITAPWGSGAVAYVDAADVGAVAAEALLNSEHEQFANTSFDVNGPEALTPQQLVQVLSQETGQSVRYVDMPEGDYAAMMAGYGMPRVLIDALLELYVVYRNSWAADTANNIQQLIGRPPRTFADYVRDHRTTFAAAAALPNATRRVLVTGATGVVGTNTVKALLYERTPAKRVAVRVATREAGRADRLRQLGAEVAVVDIDRPETFDAALVDVDVVFIVPPFSLDMLKVNNAWVDAARRAATFGGRVRLIVKLGAIHSPRRAFAMLRWHDDGERYVKASGIPYVFLRCNIFQSNFMAQVDAIKRGKVFQRNGTALVASVDPRDIGYVAAAVLSAPNIAPHVGKVYTITGPESITTEKAACILTNKLRRTVVHAPLPDDVALKSMIDAGTPEPLARALVKLADLQAGGFCDTVTDTIQKVAGKRPFTFEEFVDYHIDKFFQ